MKIQNLTELISRGESETLEFKLSFNRETIETLTAFANTSGGSVILGVNDAGMIKGIKTGKESS